MILVGGFVLAAAATLAVFLTDNPQYLRIAVVAVAWAFVLAAFAAGRRGGDRAAAAARESELRHAYELELEREIAARREYELGLENEIRRETEDTVRDELDALRGEIASLSGLRDEVAQVAQMRGDLAALSGLREQVSRITALGDDVAALASLRQELGQLAELRADMGRLRAELTEQLSSEMLVERIIMRTQASRLPAEPTRDAGRTIDAPSSWADDPPRGLTGGWPAINLDEPRDTRHFDQVHVDRTTSRPPVPEPSWHTTTWEPSPAESRSWDAPTPAWEAPPTGLWPAAPLPPDRSGLSRPAPATSAFSASPPPPAAPPPASAPPPSAQRPSAQPPVFDALSAPLSSLDPLPAPASADRWSSTIEPDFSPRRSRHSAANGATPPPTPPSTIAAPVTPQPTPMARPDVPPRRRRDEAPAAPPPSSAEYAPTTQRPAVPLRPSPTPRTNPSTPAVQKPDFDRSAFRFAARDDAPPAPPNPELARLLDQNAAEPPSGGRRRRRYRDDGEADDVLARVLREN
jgi:hypothetical protein